MSRNAQTRIVLAVVCWLGSLAVANQCQGDTVSTAAVSLEWKVDSADHIYEAIVASDAESPWEGRFEIDRPLKGNQSISSIPNEVIDRCRLKFHVYPEHRQPYPKYLPPKKPIIETRCARKRSADSFLKSRLTSLRWPTPEDTCYSRPISVCHCNCGGSSV